MPDATSDVGISLSGPVTGTIQSACAAITAGCNFLCTVQGQALIAAMIKDTAAAKQAASAAWAEVSKLFHG
jgi:hypothetical protein